MRSILHDINLSASVYLIIFQTFRGLALNRHTFRSDIGPSLNNMIRSNCILGQRYNLCLVLYHDSGSSPAKALKLSLVSYSKLLNKVSE